MTTLMKAAESAPQPSTDCPADKERSVDLEDGKIPTMIGHWDRSLHNRSGNRAYDQWFGIDPRKLAGMHLRDVLEEDRYLANLPFMEAALGGHEQQFEDAIADEFRDTQATAQFIQ